MLKQDLSISLLDENFQKAIQRELASRECEYFIEEFVKIEDRDVKGIVIPFTLWDGQRNALKQFLVSRHAQVLKANQLGLTWLILSYATWKLFFNVGFSCLAISETETKAKEICRRIDFILRHMPSWMISNEKNDTIPWFETHILKIIIHHPPKIVNGKKVEQEDSILQAFPSSPTAGASFTANLFLFDEWALQEYAREIWEYAFPTINRPTGGQVIGISTIEPGTLFEDIWKGDNDFVKIFLGWFTDPRRDKEWYEKTLKQYGRDHTHKHYPATEEEAFEIPGGTFFHEFSSLIHLKKPLDKIPDWYQKYRSIDYGLDMLACYFYYIDNKGFARIYREIHKPGLIISQAAYEILKESGARVPETVSEWDALDTEMKRDIATTCKEEFVCTFAPPDLFDVSSQTGRSSSDIWYDNGITLTKVKNDFEPGCIAMATWLHPITLKEEQTGEEYQTARLTIDGTTVKMNCAPKLVNSLITVQKDKHRPEVFSKQPHALSHSLDSVRYYCTEMIVEASIEVVEEKDSRAIARHIPTSKGKTNYEF